MFSICLKTDMNPWWSKIDVPGSAELVFFFKFTSFEQKVGSFPIMKRSPYWMVFEVGPTKNEGQTGHSQIESHLPSQRPWRFIVRSLQIHTNHGWIYVGDSKFLEAPNPNFSSILNRKSHGSLIWFFEHYCIFVIFVDGFSQPFISQLGFGLLRWSPRQTDRSH